MSESEKIFWMILGFGFVITIAMAPFQYAKAFGVVVNQRRRRRRRSLIDGKLSHSFEDHKRIRGLIGGKSAEFFEKHKELWDESDPEGSRERLRAATRDDPGWFLSDEDFDSRMDVFEKEMYLLERQRMDELEPPTQMELIDRLLKAGDRLSQRLGEDDSRAIGRAHDELIRQREREIKLGEKARKTAERRAEAGLSYAGPVDAGAPPPGDAAPAPSQNGAGVGQGRESEGSKAPDAASIDPAREERIRRMAEELTRSILSDFVLSSDRPDRPPSGPQGQPGPLPDRPRPFLGGEREASGREEGEKGQGA